MVKYFHKAPSVEIICKPFLSDTCKFLSLQGFRKLLEKQYSMKAQKTSEDEEKLAKNAWLKIMQIYINAIGREGKK